MIYKTLLWLSRLGLMLAVATALLACSVSPHEQASPNANTLSPNEQNSPDANKGAIVQAQVSWARSYGTLGDLAQAADLIVKGKVVGIARSYVDQGIPFTNFDVEVDPVLKGLANSTIQVKQTGTLISPGYEISDDPVLVPGKTYFLFLSKGISGVYWILGGPQGRFEVLDGRVYSVSALYQSREITDLGVAGTPLPDFTQQVRKSLEIK